MRAWFGIGLVVGFTIASGGSDAGLAQSGAGSRGTINGMDPPPPYGGQQGENLVGGIVVQGIPLGENLHLALTFDSAVDADGRIFDQVYLDKTELVATRGGQQYRGHELEGVTFTGQGLDMMTYQVVVDAYFIHRDLRHHSGPDFADYRVSLVGYGDLCDGRRAMPVGGTWSAQGERQDDPLNPTFTFACADGVMFKCIDFGYRPWEDVFGTSIAGVSWQPLAGTALHQTCTRMARADYCADGMTHTMNDTWIYFYDIFDTFWSLSPTAIMPTVHPDPYHPSERYNMYFEAAWRPGRSGKRPESAAICLSKKRWSTIPLDDSLCPLLLPDPRTLNGKLMGARFCDDEFRPLTESDLENSGALLFNDSAFVDLGLFRWFDGSDYYTNSAYVDFGLRPEYTMPPGPPFLPPADFQGAVFNHKTRWVPQGLLYLCSFIRGPSDYLTTTTTSRDCPSPDPSMWALDDLQGLIYPLNHPTNTPLYLYLNTLTGRYLTTTQMQSPPYVGGVIGYLPR